jgi:hypothetical protein
MTVMTLQAPGAPSDGFVPLGELRTRAGTLSRQDFVAQDPRRRRKAVSVSLPAAWHTNPERA